MALPFTNWHSVAHGPREWETGQHVEGHGWRPVRGQEMLGMGAVAEGALVEASHGPQPEQSMR